MIRKVLIIDDDPIFSEIIRQSLAKLEVALASDVLSGMTKIDQFGPDLIVLDVMMPASNGLNLLNELVSYDDTVKIPIIICSSIADNLNQDQFKNLNVVKILDKGTMSPDDIYYQIRRMNNE